MQLFSRTIVESRIDQNQPFACVRAPRFPPGSIAGAHHLTRQEPAIRRPAFYTCTAEPFPVASDWWGMSGTACCRLIEINKFGLRGTAPVFGEQREVGFTDGFGRLQHGRRPSRNSTRSQSVAGEARRHPGAERAPAGAFRLVPHGAGVPRFSSARTRCIA